MTRRLWRLSTNDETPKRRKRLPGNRSRSRSTDGLPYEQFDQHARDYVAEVERLALGQSDSSRVLQALGHAQTAQSAHAFLLGIGCWSPTTNPYPSRAGVPAYTPDLDVPSLPDEPRRDLTHLTALAIDDEGSNDPDDAISVEDGHLWVHIADVAALIQPGTALDDEARSRGANLYLPEGTARMLPDDATTRLALGLQETSPALSFRLAVDEEGQPTIVEITPSWVRVERQAYVEAEGDLDAPPLTKSPPSAAGIRSVAWPTAQLRSSCRK